MSTRRWASTSAPTTTSRSRSARGSWWSASISSSGRPSRSAPPRARNARRAGEWYPAPAMRLVRVAVPLPRNDTYVYALPDGEPPEPGLRVLVPLGRRRLWGTVLEEAHEAPRGVAVRPIAGIPEPRLTLTPEVVALCRWVADYYAAGFGETLAAAVPALAALRRRAPRAETGVEDHGPGAPPPAREALNSD